MPSLEDLRSKLIVSGTPATDDLVPFFDVSEFGNSPVKKTTVANLRGASSTADLTTSDGTTAAAAGKLGEFITDTDGVEPIANYTATTLASVALTPGDWDLEGVVQIEGDMASISTGSCGFNTAASMPSSFPNSFPIFVNSTTETTVTNVVIPRRRFMVSANTTIYLMAEISYSAGAVNASGHITARRVR